IFLRYQLGLALLLFSLPWIARSAEFHKYLGNLFLPNGYWAIFFITILSCLAGVPLILASELTFTYGRPRFGIPSPSDSPIVSERWFRFFTGRNLSGVPGHPTSFGIIRFLRFVLVVFLSLPTVYFSAQGAVQLGDSLWAVIGVIIGAYM